MPSMLCVNMALVRCPNWRVKAEKAELGASSSRRCKQKAPNQSGLFSHFWRRRPESNRRTRLCRPLHNHFATPPGAQHRIVAIHEEPRICRADKQKGKQGFPSGLSGKRGSNSRPQPWQGCALPTELFPRNRLCRRAITSTRPHISNWSGKRGSNSRPQPWQGCALPTELFPHFWLPALPYNLCAARPFASHHCNARTRLWQRRIAVVNTFAQEFLEAHFARSRICGQASFM